MIRPFTIIDAPQRSPEWFAARLGRVTGSVAGDMLATLKKGGEAASRRKLRLRLALERLTKTPQENTFVSAAMQWGIDQEPAAFAAYEALTGDVAQRTGFLSHDTIAAGCSLDGHVGDFKGIVEIKCPESTTHLDYMLSGTVPEDYMPQITHSLWVTGAQWCDFLSFDPRFDLDRQAFLVRVARTSVDLAAYELALVTFLREIDVELAKVLQVRGGRRAA